MRPVDASSLIVIDRTDGPARVLMGRRSARHTFMPSVFVFPGGRVDRGDGSIGAATELRPEDRTRLLLDMKGRPTVRRARALALAGLRETAEETGHVLGHRGDGANEPIFDRCGRVPALDALRFVARATTPPGRTRRFDTRFFACFLDRLPDATRRDDATDELEQVQWVPLERETGLDMHRITRIILDELRVRLRRDPDLAADLPIPHHHMRFGSFMRVEL